MDVIFRGEEKNYTGFIMIDSFGSGTAFKKEKQSCFQNRGPVKIYAQNCLQAPAE